MQRRRFLATVGTAAVAGVAGCVSLSGGDGGPGGSGGGGSGGSGDARATLETLSVGGSPGGPMPVLPAAPALLDFWATWCAPCKPQMAELRTVREQFPDAHILSITNERDTAAVEEFWREFEGTWAVAQDTELRTNERFDVTRMPTLLVFDAEGTEVWRHVGLAAADSIAAELREAGAGGA